MTRRLAPLQIQQQLGFFGRFTPWIVIGIFVSLFHVWKDVEADRLRTDLFSTQRYLVSSQGEYLQVQAKHSSLISLAHLEVQAVGLGMVWPDATGQSLRCDSHMHRGLPEIPRELPKAVETLCAK
jgi:hypothetical protein